MRILDYDYSKREIAFICIILALLLLTGFYAWNISEEKTVVSEKISSFEECVDAGNPVIDSNPEQCEANGDTFVDGFNNYKDAASVYWLRYPDTWQASFNQQYDGEAPDWSQQSQPIVLKPSEAANIEGAVVYASGSTDLADGIRGEWTAADVTPEITEQNGIKIEKAVREVTEDERALTQHTYLLTKENGKSVSLIFTEKCRTQNDDNDYEATKYLPEVQQILESVKIF